MKIKQNTWNLFIDMEDSVSEMLHQFFLKWVSGTRTGKQELGIELNGRVPHKPRYRSQI